MPRLIAVLVLIPFAALSTLALVEHGYWGLFQHQLANSAGWQVLADLCIAAALACVAVYRDARSNGRNPWPWIIATAALGSLALLAYYAVRGADSPGYARAQG